MNKQVISAMSRPNDYLARMNSPSNYKVIAVLLGPEDKYLGWKGFETAEAFKLFEKIMQPLMYDNIEGTKTLRERFKNVDFYFPFLGRVHNMEVIDLTGTIDGDMELFDRE